MKKVLTFIGADSKVGTTMVAQSVAETLVKNKQKVLLVLASGEFGDDFISNETIGCIDELKGASVLTTEEALKLINVTKNGLSYVGGSRNIVEIKQFNPNVIDILIGAVYKEFDYIVIDGGHDLQMPLPIGSIIYTDELYYVFAPNEKAVKRFGYFKDMIISQILKNVNNQKMAAGKDPVLETIIVNKVSKKMLATYSKEQISQIYDLEALDLPYVDSPEKYELEKKTMVGNKGYDKALNKLVAKILVEENTKEEA